MTDVEHVVRLNSTTNPTLDQIQEFLDKCKELGMSGNTKTAEIGSETGYHFTGTYKFTPAGIHAKATVKA